MSSPDEQKKYRYLTKIWKEDPEDDNPFAAKACYCYGYDVYGDILQKASWFEYLYLLFKGERPTKTQANLLEKLSIVLANPGPREASVRAAMNGGNGGSTHAASLISALAVGAGQYGGSQEVAQCMRILRKCGMQLSEWRESLTNPNKDYSEDIWLPIEHAPGFDPNSISCPTYLLQIIEHLSRNPEAKSLQWLVTYRSDLEEIVGYPASLSLFVAAGLHDLGFDEDQAVMFFLILRLPGAAVHALEQLENGWKSFPFYGNAIKLEDDPGDMGVPNIEEFEL